MLQKIRQPDTFAGAIATIAVVLGYDNCAATVGKSEGLIRQWADPDQDAKPNVEQAAKLDALYVASTGLPGPIGALMVEMTKPGEVDENKPLSEHLIDVHGSISDLHGELRVALSDGKVSKAERARILTRIGTAKDELSQMERDVKRVS